MLSDAESLTIRFNGETAGVTLSQAAAVMELAYLLELLVTFSARPILPLSMTLPSSATLPSDFTASAGCPISTGPVIEIVLRQKDVALPIISANTAVLRAVEAELLSQLRALPDQRGMANRLRHEIRVALPSGRVTVKDIGRRLGISPRSLQRHLQHEGVSFQAILDETRAEMAMIYMRDRQLSAEEASYLLAYRDPNSFYRAFREWTGMTPAEARGRLRHSLA